VSSIAGLTDRGTVAAYVCVNTTRISGRNYTTSRDATCPHSEARKDIIGAALWFAQQIHSLPSAELRVHP
jgi:hypothetical protein